MARADSSLFIVASQSGSTIERTAPISTAASPGVLKTAQALGDFESLDRTRRRALLIQLPQRDRQTIARALDLLLTRTSA